ncbi:MAG: FeoB-associated Cys-rich membrane protein [Oscillospiraceae bacterium]|nr:FeoB-associated Cys-rich membrane protein [Oscillospiraceae bacterium]
MEYISYAILALIIIYAAFIIVRRMKKIKKGQYCDCGCDSCPHAKNCGKEQNNSKP